LLLKAMLLTNAGIWLLNSKFWTFFWRYFSQISTDIQLEDSQSVYKLRETLLIALQECVSVLRPFNCVNHLSQILLCMPLLRQLDAVTRRYWNNVRREGNVPMNKLFVEMLESNITMRWLSRVLYVFNGGVITNLWHYNSTKLYTLQGINYGN
jgi:hypothetical protein